MKTTFRMKLMAVLAHGSLSVMNYNELVNEINASYNDPDNRNLYTKDQELSEIKELSYSKLCYRFVPYSDQLIDLCEIRQWTDDCRSIVNYVYSEIMAELGIN